MIDDSAVSNRVMPWLAWKYRISGELYFSVNEAFGDADVGKDVYRFGGNGDGTLFYPGRAGEIGGIHDVPIESMRLKLIREGLEDYEYFVLLDRLGPKGVVDASVGRIVESAYRFSHDSHVLMAVRSRIADQIERYEHRNTARR
jgi:hypothetical protein